MIDYISISTLNDFIFCPYSIYLHNVYMETDETMYHAIPHTQGRMAHATIDKKTASNRSDVILSLPVYSEEYGLMGIKETMNFYYCRSDSIAIVSLCLIDVYLNALLLPS